MRVLVTGATGFIGQHLTRHLMAAAHEVHALVRTKPKAPVGLHAGIRQIQGNLHTGEGLAEAVQNTDAVIHLAGVTRASSRETFFATNAEGTRALAKQAALAPNPPRFIYCSSLAAAGPSRRGTPRTESDPAAPVSQYGQSKLAGEEAVKALAPKLPALIIRPPVVYGVGDRDFLPTLLPMARRGFLLKSGFVDQHYSLLHVDDLCRALLASLNQGKTLQPERESKQGLYFLSDGVIYNWAEVGSHLAQALGRSKVRLVPLPHPCAPLVGAAAEWLGRYRGEVPLLNRDKARELACEAWTCTSAKAVVDLGFSPHFSLRTGLRQIMHCPLGAVRAT